MTKNFFSSSSSSLASGKSGSAPRKVTFLKAVDLLNKTTNGFDNHMKGLDPKTRISNVMN
jgi:hypothetical protein